MLKAFNISFKERTRRKCPAAKAKGFYQAYKESSGSRFKGEHRQIVLRSEAQKVFTKVP